MTKQPSLRPWDIYLRITFVVVFMALAAFAGYWFGALFSSDHEVAELGVGETPQVAAPIQAALDPQEPPLFFFAKGSSGDAPEIVRDEVRMAARAGIQRVMLTVHLLGDQEADVASVAQMIETARLIDPNMRVFLNLNLNPRLGWLTDHPDEVTHALGTPDAYVSAASELWRTDVANGLSALLDLLREKKLEPAIQGYMLSALEQGNWQRPISGYDTCAANRAAFRAWLAGHYADDTALRKAWADPNVTLTSAEIPPVPAAEEPRPVFFSTPADQRYIDFLQYSSDVVADAILAFAQQLRNLTPRGTQLLVPYGYSFEEVQNQSGHLALGRVLDGPIDAIVSPVSYYDRGLGSPGGFMSPIDSAHPHGKQWYIVDDTRTGIHRDATTGEIKGLEGTYALDIFNIHKRNFAEAVSQGVGLMWTDADSDGALYDQRIWAYFREMRDAYRHLYEAPTADQGQVVGFDPIRSERVPMAIVVDEASRFHQRADLDMNRLLLREAASNALRAGIPCQFVLLDDVLHGRCRPAEVYVFLNAFCLSASERADLHTLLDRLNAAAIWLYAPGYIDGTADVANISATTRINVRAFETPSPSGSVFKLVPPSWPTSEVPFGERRLWDPLFYIDDPSADVLATYVESGKPSAAMATFDEGWTSIYIAEPALSVMMLREVLQILEKHVYLENAPQTLQDSAYFGPNMVAVHAHDPGEKTLSLGKPCDVTGLLESQSGWQHKATLSVPMRAGETRLLYCEPSP